MSGWCCSVPGRALHGSLRDLEGAAGPAEQWLGGQEEERGRGREEAERAA